MTQFRRIAAHLVFLSAAVPAFAQTPVGSRSITMTLQATSGKDGEPAHGLTAADFRLLDNKTPSPVLTAKELTPAHQPASLFIVVDAVNINYTHVAYVRSEIDKFLTANGGKLAHPATFVIVTDKGAQIQQGFSQDGKLLASALKQFQFGLREIRRDSGIWGADERTQISITALQNLISHASSLPGRKLILWVSPGWPLLSGPRIDLAEKQRTQIFRDVVNLSTLMRTANVTLYNINPIGPGESLAAANYYEEFTKAVKKPADVDLADLSLQVLAEQSGGRTFISNSDVAGNLARSAADADAWYEITFNQAGSEKPDEYHQIQIDTDKPGTAVRTRNGYYTQQ